MVKCIKLLLLLNVLFLMGSLPLQATHIRAGEITAERIDSVQLTFKITVSVYCDAGSPLVFGSTGILEFGDGTSLEILNNDESKIPRTRINEDTWKYTLTRTHTFPAQEEYIISYKEFNRNGGILNMDDSEGMPFYLETVLVVDDRNGLNNTPVLLVPPVDKAAVGKPFIHNPGAYDPDGDSLSYRLVVSKQAVGEEVANYRFPNETFPEGDPRNGSSVSGGEPTFILDPLTGNLIWDSPGTQGEYNAAFLVEEWRKVEGEFHLMGYVTRDMQILVEETENEPPILQIPKDTCIIAGTILEEKILVSDPDNDPVVLESFGGPYSLGASYTPNDKKVQDQLPAMAQFRWETNCSHVQERPYTIQFKATNPTAEGVSLTNFQTWRVTVIAPPPTISSLKALDSRSVELNFNPEDYLCQEEATQLQVWRRMNSSDFDAGNCETGMPAGKGYKLVSTRGVTDFPFQDTNNGHGLSPGATYCYRIVAVFPKPRGGESLVSEEICVTLPAALPVITHVSIEETDVKNGEILVRWTPPLDMDERAVPSPFTYDLYRGEGFSGGPFDRIAENLTDTIFHDRGIDTQSGVYHYYVYLKSDGEEIDSSASASSVRLLPQPLVGSIQLNWEAQVPWSNQTNAAPYHYIYRNNIPGKSPDEFVLIDSLDITEVGQFIYLDNGQATDESKLSHTKEYCYFITTAGSYGNPKILSPLLNNSQKMCIQPSDTIPPCAPLSLKVDGELNCQELIATTGCDVQEFETRLVWEMNMEENCQDDIAFWEIYFSPTGEDESYNVVGTSLENHFVHEKLRTLAGYYFIVAVDLSGNRSPRSELVQRDNCPNYWLPNVFTPNDDDVNDVFAAPSATENQNRCPRFVESVVFVVYNRWGKEIFSYATKDGSAQEKSVYIEWNGHDNNGNMVSAGTYYYVANVTFDVLDPAKKEKEFRGWIQIVKGNKDGNIVSGTR